MNEDYTNYRVRLGQNAASMVVGSDELPQQALETGIIKLKNRVQELEEQLAQAQERIKSGEDRHAAETDPDHSSPTSEKSEDLARLTEAFQRQEQQLWAMRETLISQLKMTRICLAALMEKRGGEDMDELVDMASELHLETMQRTKLMTPEEREKHDGHEQDLMDQARLVMDRMGQEKFEEREEELER